MLTRRHFIGTTAATVAGGGLVGCAQGADAPDLHSRDKAVAGGIVGHGGSVEYAASLYADTDARLITDSTPAADGYRFPGEWESHEATIMAMAPPQNWVDAGFTAEDVRAQWAEVANAVAEEFGDLLFVMANLARHLDVDPEEAVRAANRKFARRFASIEAALAERGKTAADSDLAEMDALWDAAKAEERGAGLASS